MKDKVLKILCYECKGTGYRNDICCIECHVCHGKRYTERTIKAEDLSVEEQWKIVKCYLDAYEIMGDSVSDCFNFKRHINASIEHWAGLKGSE